jgi:ABC-type antimicrobial peptide transport system permease subunit
MDARSKEPSPVPRVHPLEVPFVWFGIQFIEFAIVWGLMLTLVPEDIPTVVGITIFVAIMAGIAVVNYRIRRRYIPR